jgi:hypothetical protein
MATPTRKQTRTFRTFRAKRHRLGVGPNVDDGESRQGHTRNHPPPKLPHVAHLEICPGRFIVREQAFFPRYCKFIDNFEQVRSVFL